VMLEEEWDSRGKKKILWFYWFWKKKSGFLMNTMKMVMKNEERKKTNKSKINQVFVVHY
jgi:hypothetical protein